MPQSFIYKLLPSNKPKHWQQFLRVIYVYRNFYETSGILTTCLVQIIFQSEILIFVSLISDNYYYYDINIAVATYSHNPLCYIISQAQEVRDKNN